MEVPTKKVITNKEQIQEEERTKLLAGTINLIGTIQSLKVLLPKSVRMIRLTRKDLRISSAADIKKAMEKSQLR